MSRELLERVKTLEKKIKELSDAVVLLQSVAEKPQIPAVVRTQRKGSNVAQAQLNAKMDSLADI